MPETVYSTLELDVLGEVLDRTTVVDETKPRVDAADNAVLSEVAKLRDEGSFDAALDQLQISLDESPNVPEYLLLKAATYLEQKRYLLGISSATATLKLAPDEDEARFMRGECHFHLGNFDDARQDLSACLDAENFNQESEFFLCAMDCQHGDYLKISERLTESGTGDGPRAEACRFIQAFDRLSRGEGQAASETIEDLIITMRKRNGEVDQSTIETLQLFFGETYPDFSARFVGTGTKAGDSILNDKTIACPDCGFHSKFDESYCSHCKKSQSVSVQARVNGSSNEETLKLLADRLFESHELVTTDPQELARAYVRSCVRCGLSLRYVENFKSRVRLDSALSETALLSKSVNICEKEIRKLLLTLVSSNSYDIVQLREDANIRDLPFLVDLLTPKLRAYTRADSYNQIRVINDSVFDVSNVRVVVDMVIQSDGTHKEVRRSTANLAAGEDHYWYKVFRGLHWRDEFGLGFLLGNSLSVSVKHITCNEDLNPGLSTQRGKKATKKKAATKNKIAKKSAVKKKAVKKTEKEAAKKTTVKKKAATKKEVTKKKTATKKKVAKKSAVKKKAVKKTEKEATKKTTVKKKAATKKRRPRMKK